MEIIKIYERIILEWQKNVLANGVVKHTKEKLECLVTVIVIVLQNVKKKLVNSFIAQGFYVNFL